MVARARAKAKAKAMEATEVTEVMQAMEVTEAMQAMEVVIARLVVEAEAGGIRGTGSVQRMNRACLGGNSRLKTNQASK